MAIPASQAAFRDIVGLPVRVKAVDIGANPIDGTPPYGAMLRNGSAEVVGFEPNLDALARLEAMKGPHETYLPCAVGDGQTHNLHICKAQGMTSLLEPDPHALQHFHGFAEWGTVTDKVPLPTVRLDDIPQTVGMDLLKIDIQGAELLVFQNGVERLRDACVIHTEVEFLPLYRDQPLFSDVDQFLRAQGFVLHRFYNMDSRILSPMVLDGNPYAALSQHVFTDAVFIKDFTRLNRFATPQLLKTAAILHDCYGSFDMALHLLVEHDARTGGVLGPVYLAGLQTREVAAAA